MTTKKVDLFKDLKYSISCGQSADWGKKVHDILNSATVPSHM